MFSVCSHPGSTLSPSHNTSTGPMSFLRGTPCLSHNTSTSPMSFPRGTLVPHRGWYPSPRWTGTPGEGIPLARSGWGTPSSQGWGVPPPARLHLDRLYRGRYASCCKWGWNSDVDWIDFVKDSRNFQRLSPRSVQNHDHISSLRDIHPDKMGFLMT